MGAAVDTAKEKLGNMKTAYEENGGGIKGVVAAGWEGIKGYYTAGFTFVDNLSGGKLTEIKTKFSEKTSEIKTKVSEGWENMKTTVTSKMTEWKTNASNKLTEIRTDFTTKISGIQSYVSTGWSHMKSTISTTMQQWNTDASNKLLSLKNDFTNKVESVKQGWSTRFTNIKDTATNLMETAKTNVSTKLENMKSAYNEKRRGHERNCVGYIHRHQGHDELAHVHSEHVDRWKTRQHQVIFLDKIERCSFNGRFSMESIRAKFSEKMESAKTAVSNAIDKIKGFFNFEWSLPHLKMPHFSISGSFSLNPPSVPSFGVEWYKTGGIMTSPTVFGMNGTRLMVGGEAGAEAICHLQSSTQN